MPGRKRAGEWYSPYFAPSTIVVGIVVIFVSVQAGRYVGNMMIERDKSRYTPAQVTAAQPVAQKVPAKSGHHISHHVLLSPKAKTTP